MAGMALLALLWVAAAGRTPASAETGLALLRSAQNTASEAQAALNAACATCHDLTGIEPGLYTTAEWTETIDRMVGYGAALTDAQRSTILAYLATDAPATGEGEDAPEGDEDAPEGDEDSDADAQALLNSSCTTCHDLTSVQPGVFTAAEWMETINRMRGYGAPVSEDDAEVIIQYLASDQHLASDAEDADEGGEADAEAAQALLNSSCTTCHDLAGVQPGLYTAAEWMETIDRMIGYGVSLTDEQTDLIVGYLATDR